MSHAELLRARFRKAQVDAPASPWQLLADFAVGGLWAVGFAAHPKTSDELLLVASSQGRGLFDCATGDVLARDPADDYPVTGLACVGIDVLEGIPVPTAGLDGGGLHTATPDGWTIDVVAPDWPAEQVVLSQPGHVPFADPDLGGWQVVHDERNCELRAAGFAPSGNTLVIASSCALAIYSR